MSQLQSFDKPTISSLDVAEMMEIKHYQLLEKLEGTKTVKGIIPTMTDHKIVVSEYFIESSYKDTSGKNNKCYELTKMGCEFVANKFTGEKGVLFTAKYVKRFNEMEKTQSIDLTGLSPQLQLLISMEQGIKEIEQRQEHQEQQLTAIKETFLQRDDNWRQKINGLLNGAARRSGQPYRDVRTESYRLLEERGKCQLNIRLNNLKERLADAGATKTKINDTNRMDVIEADPRLKEIYTTIVKELSIGTLV
ncbi:Phage regulatory protein Rha [compost metagenome]